MILATLTRTSEITPFFNLQPQVYASSPSTWTIADFWKTTFGVTDSSQSVTIDITQITVDFLSQYNEVTSYADLLLQDQSFYFDDVNQFLYVHFPVYTSPLFNFIQQGRAFGYCDQQLVYVDNIEYLPLIRNVSNISVSQDIKGYKKLNFLSGSLELSNVGGELDYFDSEVLNGNDARLYYLETVQGQTDYTQADLLPIAGAYIEDFSLSLRSCEIDIKDKRKSGDIKIPTELFLESDYTYIEDTYKNKVIPRAYGLIRQSYATPVDASTSNVVYRQAQELTSLGTVQVLINDVWTNKTPVGGTINLATGTFTLPTSRDTSGNPYKCRVIGSVGIDIDNPLDIIKDINERYLNIAFTDSNYNISEWNTCGSALANVGLLLDKATALYEVIRIIQDGSDRGFRYETDNNGYRTARLDDPDREESFYIENVQIQNIDEIGYETDFELLASTVTVRYAKDYSDGDYLTVFNDDNAAYSLETYRVQNSQEFETLLTSSTDADTRATNEAVKYKDVRKIVEITAMGSEFLPLRIYDVGTIELSPCFVERDGQTVTGNRCWLGVWKVQILSVSPNTSRKTNTLKCLLVEKKY